MVLSPVGYTSNQNLSLLKVNKLNNNMNSKTKGVLHTIVNIVGNGAILFALPDSVKIYFIFGFNILQVVLAFLDKTYTVEMIKMGKIDQFGNKK